MQDKIVLQGQYGAQSNLNKNMVSKIKIPIPMVDNNFDMKKQKHISDVLATIDDVIAMNSTKLFELNDQRKTLQQYLLNGIVRV